MNNDINQLSTINSAAKTSNQGLSLKSNEIETTLQNVEKLKDKKSLLQTIIMNFFSYEMPGYYCGKGRQECTNGSDLYILTQEGIIKAGAGEFNRDTFINGVYGSISEEYSERYRFKDSPLPLYVVNQGDSYFASGKIKELREQKPIEYLEKYTVLSYDPQDKSIISNYGKRNEDIEKININKDRIIGISDAILLFRNKFIENFDKEFLNEYMSKLQKLTLEELRQYDKNSKKITDENESALWRIIDIKLGCNMCGAGIYADEAIKSRYDLIHSFDTDKGEFTSIPEFNSDD